jgi:hypothetical protein
VKEIRDYVHFYRGYWSEGGKYRIRIYKEDGRGNERIVLDGRSVVDHSNE